MDPCYLETTEVARCVPRCNEANPATGPVTLYNETTGASIGTIDEEMQAPRTAGQKLRAAAS
jgi:hypothetical protein